MSTIDDLKLTELNMTKQVNAKRKEIEDYRAEADRLKKEAETMIQKAKNEEKLILYMVAEMGVLRKNAEAAAAAEKRFQEKDQAVV